MHLKDALRACVRTVPFALVTALLLLVQLHVTTPPGRAPKLATQASRAAAPVGAAAVDPAVCLPAGVAPGPSFAEAMAAKAQRETALGQAQAFTRWVDTWRRADAATATTLAEAGRELAHTRREALKYLIRTEPKRALELAVPVGLRAELPAVVQAELEQRVDARGDLEVDVWHDGNSPHYERTAVIAETSYKAYVFGRREDQQTKYQLPLHGIAIDGALALSDTPYRELDDTEKAQRGLDPQRVAVAVGPKILDLAGASDLAVLSDRLLDAESEAGPQLKASGAVFDPGSTPPTAAVTSQPSWILGTKRVLWLKLEFSDDPGEPVSDATLATTNAAVSDFYQTTSYGKTAMQFTVVPTLLRLPKDKFTYNTAGTGVLATDAKATAKQYDAANGGTGLYDPDKYDRFIMIFKSVPSFTFGGLASIGGPTVWVQTSAAGTVGHELGHTQSLDHAHYWLPSSAVASGPGTHVEYGDVFDRMGSSGSSVNNFFNVSHKAKLGYLEANSINTITQSGTYRLNRHDHRDASGTQALKIAAGDLGYEYWIEHRQFGPTSFNPAQLDRLRNGVLIHWGPEKAPKFTTGRGSYLLDATPSSAGGANDSPLRIGESFVDPDAGITFKPLAVGGATPNEYIDVQVSFGAIDGNHNPTLQAEAPAGPLVARTNIIFNATGADPDGDPIYYRWDFGDGQINPALSNITRRFPKGGSYSLRVSVHDGKGGITAKNIALQVSDPLLAWTARDSGGTTASLYGAIFAGGKFVVVGDTGTVLTSSDASSWARTSSPGNVNFRSIAYNGSRFAGVGTGTLNAVRGGAAYSDNGSTWTAATLPAGVGQLLSIAYGLGRFVAVGETGRIYNSADGTAWNEVTSPVNTSLRSVAFADNLFVATGDSGRLVISSDGVTWTNKSVATGNSLAAVTRHNGAWYASTSTLECFTSTDGASWTRIATAGRTGNTQRMISTSGVLLCSTSSGGISFTENPQTWSAYTVDATPATTFSGIAEGNGLLVMVGSRGLIYTAAQPPTATRFNVPTIRNEADSLKLSVGQKNVVPVDSTGFTQLELYANGVKVSDGPAGANALTWTPSTIGNYTLNVRGIDASGASFMSAAVPAVAGLTNWVWRNPTPVGTDLQGATRIGDQWWIVGAGGALLTLDSAGTLTSRDFPTTQRLYGIGYANGRYVIVGRYYDDAVKEAISPIWTSTDGASWTALLTSPIDNFDLYWVTYANNTWLAGGPGGTLMTSPDGLVWSRQVSGQTAIMRGGVFGNNLWVAVGASGKIVTSPDTVTWTERTSGVTTELRGVAFNNGVFVAAGASGVILTSTDGITWSRATSGSTATLDNVGVVKGTFVVPGDGGVTLVSSNGTTWSVASMENRFSNALFVAGSGEAGLILGRAGEIYTSNDPAAWKHFNQGTNDSRLRVKFAGGRFIAVGQLQDALTRVNAPPIAISNDGVAWTRANANTGFTNMNDVAYGQQTYVVVGDTGRIMTSGNALDWTQRTSGITTQLTAATASSSLFIAAGASGVVLTSADGATWARRTSGTTGTFRAATFGDGRYVIVGDGGTIIQSTDGVTWRTATSGVTVPLMAVGWFENVGFIAGGANGTLIASDDGLAWHQLETGVSDLIGAIAQTPVGLLAPAGLNGTALMSLDGTSWVITTIPVDRTVRGVAANGSTIVAVGDQGSLLTFDLGDAAAPAISAQPGLANLSPGTPVTLSISSGAAGAVYQWFKDGVAISGATSATYSIAAVASANAGTYTVSVRTASGSAISAPAALTLAAVDPGRLINLSILTSLADATDNFTFGVVIGGAGTSGGKDLLVRAAGPSLSAFGLGNVLVDPKLEFFTGSQKVGENDNWGGAALTAAAITQVGAFPFTSTTSRDAAFFLSSLASGANSARISGTGAGAVIAELYDATPREKFTASTPRLINVSVLKHIGTGITAGFVIGGTTNRSVLIRAIGPSLSVAPFNVPGAVADPQVALFRGSTQLAANDNWGGGAELSTAFTQVGAFTLAANSRDAALRANLQPGSYTVQVSGVGNTTGLALIEIYELP